MMNAKEKSAILKQAGYSLKTYQEIGGKVYAWSDASGYEFVYGGSLAVATGLAYDAYLEESQAPQPAPVAEPVIEDVLAVKNAEIARLQTENARQAEIIAILRDCDLISDCLELLSSAGNWDVWANLYNYEQDYKYPAPAAPQEEDYFKSDEYYQDLTDTFMGYDGTNNPVSKEAPQEAVTLSEDELPNHDADDFTKADLDFFARQPYPEKFWYYQELGERQKAAIAARRKELGL